MKHRAHFDGLSDRQRIAPLPELVEGSVHTVNPLDLAGVPDTSTGSVTGRGPAPRIIETCRVFHVKHQAHFDRLSERQRIAPPPELVEGSVHTVNLLDLAGVPRTSAGSVAGVPECFT